MKCAKLPFLQSTEAVYLPLGLCDVVCLQFSFLFMSMIIEVWEIVSIIVGLRVEFHVYIPMQEKQWEIKI